jgi:hypothetical protein
MKGTPVSLRPFYFVVVVWGREYRDYFLEYCLPSLLSPKNIPVLDGRRPAKFLFATTAEDWDIMRGTAIFSALEKHAETIFLELPPKGDRPYWLHSIVGHKMCCDMTARDKAYRILVCPDTVFSEGAVELFHEVALDGAEVILSLTVPLTRTDLFFKALSDMNLRPQESARETGLPIVLPAKQVVTLAMRAMHGASRINEWEAPYFCRYASTPWWQAPGESAIVTNGVFWNLFLVDYSTVQHDGSTLDARGFDGDYNMRIIGGLETIYFIRDSDEFYVVSWASTPEPPSRRHRGGEFAKGAAFRVSAYGPVFNDFQRDTLFMPTLVRSGDLSEEWDAVEQKALQTMATWLDTPVDIERYSRRLPVHRRNFAGLQAKIAGCRLPWWRRNPLAWGFVRHVVVPAVRVRVRAKEFLVNFSNVGRRAILALRGDAGSIERLRWHSRRLMAKALRRPFG